VPHRLKGAAKLRPEEPISPHQEPRLIPLPDEELNRVNAGKLQHYINLANIALKTARKSEAR